LKYKNCCESSSTRRGWSRYAAGGALALVIGIGLVLAVVQWATSDPSEAPPGKVWNAEHGHYHDLAPQPVGAAPAGKVWNAEHGHYHDAPAGGAPGAAPAGAPLPGQVWSEEHGHYHDPPAPGSVVDELEADSLPPLDGTETSPAPVSEAPDDGH
jgi:hypothetical protein